MTIRVFAVVPHEAIGPVRLGMSRAEIRRILGEPSATQQAHEKRGIQFPDKDYFFKNAFQVSFDADLRADFIEVSAESGYIVTFEGVPVHGSPPDVVLAAIQKFDEADTTAREYPLNVWFPKLRINLYRESSEEAPFDTIGICVEGYGEDIKA